MPDFTADVILGKVKRGEKIDRADLRGIQLQKAVLEGASFRRCDFEGANLEGARLAKANLKNASLREAYLAGADLREANLDNADLEGANLEAAMLAGANLGRANLEGANLSGADLTGAKLSHAQLDSANLSGAKLSGAVLTHADLVECDLGIAMLDKADLTSANLESANLEEASFVDANLSEADLGEVNAKGTKFSRASLHRANLSKANLQGADLTGADLRNTKMNGAKLDGATLTGAKISGVVAGDASFAGIRADWADGSPDGNGKTRVAAADVAGTMAGIVSAPSAIKRYFGKGDVLRNASLQFDEGASVEIESLFEQCTIALGRGTELVVGGEGVLSGCQITGAGNITIHGKFFERTSPGIAGANQLIVTSGGALVGAVEQSEENTRFAFEPGCRLRMKILQKERKEWEAVMADPVNGGGEKQTLVEEGTQFKGSLTSSCPIVVRGKVDGDLTAPSLTVSPSGSVRGSVKVGEMRSQGELAGEFDADVVQLSGTVRDNTVIRAKSLEELQPAEGKMQVIFGECALEVGDMPTKEKDTKSGKKKKDEKEEPTPGTDPGTVI